MGGGGGGGGGCRREALDFHSEISVQSAIPDLSFDDLFLITLS